MSESLTFLTVLSAAPAALKFAYDALGFYSKVKALRSPAPARPLAKSDSLSATEKSQINRLYTVVASCRPVAADIAKRELRFYLAIGAVVITLLAVFSVVLTLVPALPWLLSGVVAIAVLGPALIRVLPRPVPWFEPFKAPLPSIGLNLIRHDLIRELEKAWSHVSFSMRLFALAGGVSIPERVFLRAYSVAEAFLTGLECDLLTKDLRTGMSRTHEEVTDRVFCAGSAGNGERVFRVSVDAALREGIFKASGSFEPMGLGDGRRKRLPRP